jgi:hypothetical protein
MATAIMPLDKLQLGIEVVSTKGTAVAATRLIRANSTLAEEQDYYRSDYPQGIRANVGGAGSIMRKGVMLGVETDLTAEEVLWPLMTGVLGSVSPTGGGNAKTWTFTPELTTAVTTIQSATVEMLHSDGSTNHYYGESSYCMTSSFKCDWAFNQPSKLSWNMFGRARQTDTPTGALVPYTSREILVSNSLAYYLDTTWAGLGGTQKTIVLRSASFECTTGYGPDYTLDARTDVDFTQHNVGRIAGTLSLTMEVNSTGAAAFTNYRANDIVYIRLKNTGSAISGGGNKTFQIDGAYRFTSTPTFSADGDVVLVTYNLESVYDSTSGKTLEFTAINTLTTIA